jgi:hypothetical protein
MPVSALPRSFVFAQGDIPPIAGAERHSLPIGNLAITPEVEWHATSSGGSHLLLIGTVFDLDHRDRSARDIADRLLAEGVRSGIDAMLASMDSLLGRFAIVAEIGGQRIAFNDAAATRTVYFARYNGKIALSSHATLLAGMLDIAPRTGPVRLIRHWPANETVYPGVRQIIPNFALYLESGSLRRFWPREERATMPLEEAIDRAESLLVRAAECVASKWRPAVSLTGGLDSRTTLAAFKGIPIATFTYWNAVKNARDLIVARDIAYRAGVPHALMDCFTKRVRPPRILAQMPEYRHIDSPLSLVQEHFSGPGWMHVRSNLAEIGRAFWRKSRVVSRSPRLTPELMTRLVRPRKGRRLSDEDRAYAERSFAEFLPVLGYQENADGEPELLGYDGWDLYYWEHRMSSWHGPLVLGTDLIFDTMILFNSRAFLKTVLSVPLDLRREGVIYSEIVRRRLPEIADIPINPPRTQKIYHINPCHPEIRA